MRTLQKFVCVATARRHRGLRTHMSTEGSAFKAILWKEFRENLKWAVLGMIFVSVGEFFSFQKLLNQTSWGGSLNWGSVSYSLFWATPYLAPVVGLMIGVAQVI